MPACNSYKKVLYFQDLDRVNIRREPIKNYSALVIQTEDILEISVASLNPEASAVFSFSSAGGGAGGTAAGSEYLVDHAGFVNFPLLGYLKVAGSTTSSLRKELSEKLLIYLKEPIINVRIVNFKVSVIGDVATPGVYSVGNEKITIPEVLSMAGDINLSAKRNNILLIREQDGNREYIPIDLTKNIFQSPYYYLKNNDLIYVQPGRNKVGGFSQTFGLFVSIISVASIVVQVLR
jgi:polysaccharide biosynthesis/export protein